MSTPKLSPEFQAQLRELAASWGKSAAKRLIGELGPNLPMDFNDIEKFAILAAAGVTEGALATLLEQKTQGIAQSPCPECGASSPVERREQPLALSTGQAVARNEPISHCPHCRRHFFPTPDRPAAG